MSSTLSYYDTHDRIATPRALLLLSPVDARFVHTSVNHAISEVAPKLFDRFDESFLNRFVEF